MKEGLSDYNVFHPFFNNIFTGSFKAVNKLLTPTCKTQKIRSKRNFNFQEFIEYYIGRNDKYLTYHSS